MEYITIAVALDFPVFPLNVCPQDSHFVELIKAGPSAPPHQVHFTFLIEVLLHFGQLLIMLISPFLMPYSYSFSVTPRFFYVVSGLHFLLFFFVTLGGQPFGFRRPSFVLNLPITRLYTLHYIAIYPILNVYAL